MEPEKGCFEDWPSTRSPSGRPLHPALKLTSLVADKGRQVRGLGCVVLGEGLHPTATTAAALPWVETQGTAPGVLKLRT